MDYEKLHKDTINKLQQMVNSGKITVEIARGICADFVPESEDERIRKKLISYFSAVKGFSTLKYNYGITNEEAVAWLEKQGNNIGISEATKQKLEDSLNKALEKETPESWSEFLDEQKPAWSEEDSNMLQSILDEYKSMAIEKRNWLKSLRPHHHWKPSNEQMKALKEAVDEHFDIDGGVLWHLYEQLKKLREE